MSSREVVDRVGRLLRTRRAGHAGTLDPLATGLLIVCVGQATRLVSRVQGYRKRYEGSFRLGFRSDTDDATGRIEATGSPVIPTLADVEAALARFVGSISQVPPAFSAVHVSGQRAYALARRGMEVELSPRVVQVDSIGVVRYDFPDLTLTIECGSGTYVRALGRDLGEILGCGAIMSALRRTRIGPWDVAQSQPVEDLTRPRALAALQSLEAIVGDLPRRVCTSEECHEILNGRPLGTTLLSSPLSSSAMSPATTTLTSLAALPVAATSRDVATAGATEASEGALFTEQGRLLAIAERQGPLWQPRLVFPKNKPS